MNFKNFEFREDQILCANAIKKLPNNGMGRVIDVTGSGKTLVIGKCIIDDIKERKEHKVYTILTPIILLTNQTFEFIRESLVNFGIDAEYLIVNSGGKKDSDDLAWFNAIRKAEIRNGIPYRELKTTTSNNEIAIKYLKAKENNIPLIIIGNYHSAHRILQAKVPIELLFCDEAAELVSSENREKEFKTIVRKIQANKKIYLTATQKFTKGDYGMNNVNHFGEMIYHQTPYEAINKGIIVPPRMHLVDIEEDNINDIFDYSISSKMRKNNKDDNATAHSIISSFKKHKEVLNPKLGAKILVTTKGTEQLDNIVNHPAILKLINEENVTVFDISSEYKSRINGNVVSRDHFLKELNNLKDEDDAIVFHIKILTRGINVSRFTAILPLNLQKRSEFIQNLGRATRLHNIDREKIRFGELTPLDFKNFIKPYAWVIIPIYGELGKELEENYKELIDELRHYGFKTHEDIFITENRGKGNKEELIPLNEIERAKKPFELFFEKTILHRLEEEKEANRTFTIKQFLKDWIIGTIDYENINIDELDEAQQISKMLPSFLFFSNNKEKTVKDILNTPYIREFKIITGHSIEKFKRIIEKYPENIYRLNQAIESFYLLRKEHENKSILNKLKTNKEILKHLNPFDNQQIMTPINVVNMMIDKIPQKYISASKTFCDPCIKSGIYLLEICIRILERIKKIDPQRYGMYEDKIYNRVVKENLFGYAINERAKLLIESFFKLGSLDNIKIINVDEIKKGKNFMPKFDVVIGNPPYKRDLHLHFLNLAIDISKEFVCFIEPANWLFNEKPKKYKGILKNIYEKLNNLNLNIETVNGTYIFDAKIFGPVGMFLINKMKGKQICINDKINGFQYKIDNINEISKYGNSETYKSLKKKILNAAKIKNMDDICYEINFNENRKKYFINMAAVRGGESNEKNKLFKDYFYNLVLKDENVEDKITKKLYFSFDTKEEAENCLGYIKTHFARFAYSIYKNTQHVNRGEMKSIPWLDFTQEWTDEKLYKYFKLTLDEIKFIEERIPKYYD